MVIFHSYVSLPEVKGKLFWQGSQGKTNGGLNQEWWVKPPTRYGGKKNNTRWEMWIFTNYGDVMDIYKKHL
jgi:hypothetical protein